MKNEEFTSREKALLIAWDQSNSPVVNDAFEVRLIELYDEAKEASLQSLANRDEATRLQMAADVELENTLAARAGATPAPRLVAGAGMAAPLNLEALARPRPYVRRLLPNPEWPAIIDDVLGDNARASEIARSTMWLEVSFYVERIARLPIGPLNDDEEARRDIGVHVLRKLEAKSCLHLREWRARGLSRRDPASWWGWIKTMSRCVSIDYARTSRRNIAPRGKPFEYAQVEFVDPFVLGSSLEALARGGEQALYEYMTSFQACHRGARHT